MAELRVIVDCPGDPYHGERGRVIDADRTGIRVRLDRLPIDCISRDMWFATGQVRTLLAREMTAHAPHQTGSDGGEG